MPTDARKELTVKDLIGHGYMSIEATCVVCDCTFEAGIDFLPSATTFSKIEALLVCPDCGASALTLKLIPHGTSLFGNS